MTDHDHDDTTEELGARLRAHATGSPAPGSLLSESLTRARRIRRRRTVTTAVAAVIVVSIGLGGLAGVAGSWPGFQIPIAGTPETASSIPESSPSGSPSAGSPTRTRVTSGPPETSGASKTGIPPKSSGPPSNDSPPPETTKQSSGQRTSSPVPPKVPFCTAAQTSVQVKPLQGMAGHTEYGITVTNASRETCTLTGYPGVSIVAGDKGTQIGIPADRDDSVRIPEVTVQPGQSATASLLLAQAGHYGEECKAVKARGFRIYLPEEKDARFAPIEVLGCGNTEIHLMQVRPFQPM